MSEKKFQRIGKANRAVVVQGVELLRKTYENFIQEKQQQGYDFKFADGMMIGHNFYKLLLYHIADESRSEKDFMLKAAIDTLEQVLEHPLTNETDTELS